MEEFDRQHHASSLPGPAPDGSTPADRRRAAGLAGHESDEPTAAALLEDPEAVVRATALGALARMGRLTAAHLLAALADPDPRLRRRAAELAAPDGAVDLIPVLDDADPFVVEAAAWALGERAEHDDRVIDALATVSADHADPLCREAAVAALGALGDARGLPAILAATTDKPAVRRRAVIALAPFDGPDVTAALERALQDRDWQVRQAAEDQLPTD